MEKKIDAISTASAAKESKKDLKVEKEAIAEMEGDSIDSVLKALGGGVSDKEKIKEAEKEV